MKAVIGLREIKELLGTEKGIKILIAVGAVLMLFIILSGFSGGARKNDTESRRVLYSDFEEYEHGLEKRLSEILADIDGVGNTSVMVTLDTSQQNEYGKNADMLISVTSPRVRGVIVVCDGGESVTVREKVVEAVSGVFGINSLRISVAGSR